MIRNQRAHLVVVLTLVTLLGLASLGGALAAPPSQGQKQGLFGVVTEVAEGSVILQRNGETVELKLDADTRVRVPGVTDATTSDIPVGSRIAVLAEQRPEGLFADRIVVIPVDPEDRHITLTVLEVSGNTVIAETSAGDQVVVELDFDLPGELKGQLITFIGKQPESNRFKAKAAIKLQNVIERLDRHVREKKQEAESEGDPQAKARKQRDVEELKARLEANLEEQLDRFAEIIAKAPQQARPALEKALESIKQGFQSAVEALDKSSQEMEDLLEQRKVKGTVESVDLEAGQVVIRSQGDALVTVNVVATTEIKIGEADGTLEEIQEGDQVEVRFDPRTGEASRIRVKLEQEVKGRIQALDAEANTLTLELPGGATLALTVPETSAVEVNDSPASLEDIQEGMAVEVEFNPRTLEALSIKGELEAEFELTVDSVDAEAGTVTGSTEEGQSITVTVTDQTRVEIEGALASIFGLQPGDRIEVEINPVTGEALNIKVEKADKGRDEAKVRGTVTQVDTTASTLTVNLPNGSEITVTVDDATEVDVDGEQATLGDIPEGARVKIEYDLDTMVALDVETQGEGRSRGEEKREAKVEGTILSVDAAAGTLTVFTEDGETLVLTVTPDTSLAFNERRIAALSDLPSAAAVKVEFTPDGNVAITIEAKKREVREERGRGRPAGRLTIQLEGDAVPGASVVFRVTQSGEPVEGAQVTVNDESIGTTDAEGRIAFDIPPDAEEIQVGATLGEQEGELELKLEAEEEEGEGTGPGQGQGQNQGRGESGDRGRSG